MRRRGRADGDRVAGAGEAGITVSVAVIVWLPAVFSVALNVPVPLVSVLVAGRRAWPSLLVK